MFANVYPKKEDKEEGDGGRRGGEERKRGQTITLGKDSKKKNYFYGCESKFYSPGEN